MISAVAENILGFIMELIFRIIIEVLFFYSGEIIRFVLTLGRKQIQWGYYSDASVTKCILITELSTWVGFAFWLSLFAFVTN
jgi:hypothetical protein